MHAVKESKNTKVTKVNATKKTPLRPQGDPLHSTAQAMPSELMRRALQDMVDEDGFSDDSHDNDTQSAHLSFDDDSGSDTSGSDDPNACIGARTSDNGSPAFGQLRPLHPMLWPALPMTPIVHDNHSPLSWWTESESECGSVSHDDGDEGHDDHSGPWRGRNCSRHRGGRS